ncbi:MAG: carbohydrate ABC transporter permease [Oscillospiraceae bacterium]|nr:carbohydrate ABC transporter permease [Oscillospiraceae bacterium]
MRKVLPVVALCFFLPVAATVALSFLSEGNALTLNNYADLLLNCFIFYPMFWNSVLYAGLITLAQFLIVIPCAFGFSQSRARSKSALFAFYIILMMMPLQVTILPNYIGLRDLGMLDTRLGIILPAVFSPFGVVVMRQYMRGTDNSTIDAMRLETNSLIKVLIHVVIPPVKVCVFAVGLFVFADCWNMLEQPLLFLESDRLKTMSVFMANASSYEGGVLFPAAVLFIVPVLLLYGFFSDKLEKGLVFGDLR